MIKTAASKKELASEAFKENKLEEAITLFDECLALDTLNLNYNATVLLNKAIALCKLKKNELALKALNLCIKYSP
jgi:tetratricopeptide (TPR) repeat protein